MKFMKMLLPSISIIGIMLVIMGCGNKKDENTAKQTADEKQTEVSLVQEGEINVDAIDTNKDGKVYQCPMDVNVISDKAGICPLCKMDLEKVTVAAAKDNLIKSDYKVK
jgi:flagellar basal body-associated protein FliL